MPKFVLMSLIAVLGVALFAPNSFAAVPCETLSTLTLPNATITMSQVVEAGKFVAPAPPPRGGGPGGAGGRGGGGRGGGGAGAADAADNTDDNDVTANDAPTAGQRGGRGGGGRGGARPNPYLNLPAFCRIGATLKPAADSEIKIEVWMPLTAWNNKLLAVGNGAWAGSISYTAMAPGLAAGYATTSTDTGHTGGRAATFIDNQEKVIDFAYRAVHEMSIAAKGITKAFYSGGPQLSYFQGCSTGGRQALTAAQRYPLDFDGIIAGATAVNASRMHGTQVWVAQQAHRDDASLIPMNKYAALHDAALKACDALDGVTDRVIDNPRQCKFNPEVLLCKEGDSPTCLTAAQVETAKRAYAGPGLFPGYEYGSEGGWNGTLNTPVGIAVDMYRYLVHKDPNWDYKTLNVEKDVPLFDKTIGAMMNSSDPNLKPFFDNGGKLLMYHGWADPGIPAANSVEYYTSVVKQLGGESKTTNSMRLFMLPGVGHCRGGDGPSTFDSLGTLDQWRSGGKTPDSILASHSTMGVIDRTRPLCPYPQVAQYKGSGDTNSAENFVCKSN
jgi:feruloyl esterase